MSHENEERIENWVEWATNRGRNDLDQIPPQDAWTLENRHLPPGASLIWYGHPDYPEPLLDLPQPPEFLYSIGRPRITGREFAIVGSRSIDHESTRIVSRLCEELVSAGVVLVSGGARGVDTLAHRAATKGSSPTIVVLPSGLDVPTPRRNSELFEEVVDHGGWILSEYPLGVSVRKHFFHRRNQLIAALSSGVGIMRARESGGTHITARAAVELGRPLFAMPGSPEDRFSLGSNEWIRRGARCVWTKSQILEDLGWETHEPAPYERRVVELSELQLRIVEAIREGHGDLQSISDATTLSSREVQIEVLGLEILGVCTRDPAAGEYTLEPVQIDTSPLRR